VALVHNATKQCLLNTDCVADVGAALFTSFTVKIHRYVCVLLESDGPPTSRWAGNNQDHESLFAVYR